MISIIKKYWKKFQAERAVEHKRLLCNTVFRRILEKHRMNYAFLEHVDAISTALLEDDLIALLEHEKVLDENRV